MIKCTVCGYENKDDAKFCLNCGSPIKKEKVSQAIDDVSEERTVLLDPESLRKRAEEDYKKEHEAEQAPPPQAPPPMPAAPPATGPAPGGGFSPPPPPAPVSSRPPAPPPSAPAAPPPQPPRPVGAVPPPPSGGLGAGTGGSMPPPTSMSPAPQGMAPGGKTNVLAIVSLVCGILSVIGMCCYVGIAMGPAALVTGFLARKQIAESNGAESGDGMALAGMICGAVGLLAFFAVIALAVIGAVADAGSGF